MDFEKKLVILTGKEGRGTVLLERNGMGNFVTLNVFALPDLTAGEYALGVKTNTSVFRREVGSLGRVKSRFALPEGEYASVHFVLFRTTDEEVVLYGTNEARKMWEGNRMDGLRRGELDEKKENTEKAPAQTQEFRYSQRKIEDYFLNIEPKAYYDNAVAQVNYFDYSQREQDSDGAYYDRPPQPSETQRAYLRRRFGAPAEKSEHTAQAQAVAAETAAVAAFASSRRDNAEPTASQEKTEPPKVKKASDYTVEQAVAAVRTGAGFYASVKSQIDTLFAEGEPYAPLERALPGTRWTKVDYDGAGRYYVVGLIGAAPDYIAYGVPGKYTDMPTALEGADFVPIDAAQPTGDGFWVLFQSAVTGKEIRRN